MKSVCVCWKSNCSKTTGVQIRTSTFIFIWWALLFSNASGEQ